MSKSQSINEQLELYSPKAKSVMEPVLCAEQTLYLLINMVAVCCVSQVKIGGGTFAEARKIAKESFAAFVADRKYQAHEGWSDFFVRYIQSRNLGVSEKNLKKLKERLENLDRKQNISELFEVRKQCQDLLATKSEELSGKSIEKIRELLYDLTFPHL